MAEERILINHKEIESRKGYHSIKRIFDVLLSVMGLIVLSPLMLVIAYKIKEEDGGPIIYKQVRVGKDGHHFEMYKFRSMVTNADRLLEKLKDQNEVDGAMFKMKNDPRITQTGHFIRKHSLDELPQLINVLKGDMSLVGPRPLLVDYLQYYNDEQIKRHNVLPGLTGWAQINGRNSITWEEKFKLDLWYVNNYSLKLDIKILFMTIYKVLKRDGINQGMEVTMERFNGMN